MWLADPVTQRNRPHKEEAHWSSAPVFTTKYGENAPMATVCCNACRTCVTTNVLGIVTGAVAGISYTVANVVRRRSSSSRV
jgi:hypothetical protein